MSAAVPIELWIALILVTALVAGVVGHRLARRSAPRKSELNELKRELEAAQKRAEEVQSNVSGHFEQSALLFGQLARDYRAFLEHFSESARQLGISEVKARELLERADRPLLGHASEVIDSMASDSGESAVAASPARPSMGEDAAERADAQEMAAALHDPAPATPPEPAPAEEATGAAAEPPVVNDVVRRGAQADAPAAEGAVPPAAPKVVDVDLDAQNPAAEESGTDQPTPERGSKTR